MQRKGVKIYRRNEPVNLQKGEDTGSFPLENKDTSMSIDDLQKQINDKRLQRLQNIENDDKEERINRRQRFVAEIIEDPVEEEKEEETEMGYKKIEDLRVERLQIAKESIENNEGDDIGELPIEEENEDVGEMEVDQSSGMEGSSDDEEEDSNELDVPGSPVMELKFVPKGKRGTVKTEEQVKKEEENEDMRKIKEAEERKKRTIELVKNQVVENEEKDEHDFPSSEEDDEETIEKEFALWKLRELKRLQREFQKSEDLRKEKEEKERRQQLTDEEVKRENEKSGRGEKDRTQYKFLQKYYHKGAFYHDDSKIKKMHETHDWAKATGEDAYSDRSVMPTVMQVKNFGKASRSKYTHLTNEDTSSKDDYWRSGFITESYTNKMGGLKNLQRPTKKKRTN
jgi:microfibrillar-associated protein 1